MNLNERAAKCMGWEATEVARGPFTYPGYSNGMTVHEWNPGGIDGKPGDYNHARMLYQRMLYQRVVKKGLEISVAECARKKGWQKTYATESVFCEALRLTAAQLTEACCEVLEAHDDPD